MITTADGSPTLRSERYGETYHSINGAATESKHVFLNASGVAMRLQQQRPTQILEIGFGLGLNCLISADLARKNQTRLDYHALENDPKILQYIANLHYEPWIETADLIPRLNQALKSLEQDLNGIGSSEKTLGNSQIFTIPLGDTVRLILHICDAVLDPLPTGEFDAIYLDAFSPETNPECWNVEFFKRLHAQTAANGVLTTYSAKGAVRRALISAGYHVNKIPGPPGKREMLRARVGNCP